LGQLAEERSGKKPISGGASDTDVSDPTASPTGLFASSIAVKTQTPVG